jgi:hypothetical protein
MRDGAMHGGGGLLTVRARMERAVVSDVITGKLSQPHVVLAFQRARRKPGG